MNMQQLEDAEKQILRALQAGGDMTKAQLARETGISASTVGKYVETLKLKKKVKVKDFGRLHLVSLVKRGIVNVREITPTNVQALVGKETVARDDIDPDEGGVIKLMGEGWICRPVDGVRIPKGSRVRVVGIEGVKLFVERLEVEK
jgi:membrane protein implicated in regulation of membrane protease activity